MIQHNNVLVQEYIVFELLWCETEVQDQHVLVLDLFGNIAVVLSDVLDLILTNQLGGVPVQKSRHKAIGAVLVVNDSGVEVEVVVHLFSFGLFSLVSKDA